MELKFGWNERAEFEQYLTRRLSEHQEETRKQMKLTGKVIEIKSGSESTDKHERVTMRLSPGPGRCAAVLILPNDEGWKLDDPVEVSISMGLTEEVSMEGVLGSARRQ